MSQLLNKAAILAATDRPTRDVEVPEWGGTVRLQAWNGKQRDAFEDSCILIGDDGQPQVGRNRVNLRARVIASSAIDDTGALLFTPEDVEALGEKSAAALDRLFDVCQQLHGLGANDVKALEGNSNATPSGTSASS